MNKEERHVQRPADGQQTRLARVFKSNVCFLQLPPRFSAFLSVSPAVPKMASNGLVKGVKYGRPGQVSA